MKIVEKYEQASINTTHDTGQTTIITVVSDSFYKIATSPEVICFPQCPDKARVKRRCYFRGSPYGSVIIFSYRIL